MSHDRKFRKPIKLDSKSHSSFHQELLESFPIQGIFEKIWIEKKKRKVTSFVDDSQTFQWKFNLKKAGFRKSEFYQEIPPDFHPNQ
jgi:hypothetical protein